MFFSILSNSSNNIGDFGYHFLNQKGSVFIKIHFSFIYSEIFVIQLSISYFMASISKSLLNKFLIE
jgi:hypothetical protein